MKNRLSTLLLLCAIAASSSASDDAAFQRVWSAVERGAKVRDEEALALRHHPLHLYIEAERYRQALQTSNDAATETRLEALLREYRGAPAVAALRQTWMQLLVARKDWLRVLDAYDTRDATDDQYCYALHARTQLYADDNTRADVRAHWIRGRTSPASCEPAFNWLEKRDGITPKDRSERMRRALLENNRELAQHAINGVDPSSRASLQRGWRLLTAPEIEFPAMAQQPQPAVDPPLLLSTYTHWSRRQPQNAAAVHDALLRMPSLTAAHQAELNGALGVAFALNRRPEALLYFQRIDGPISDTTVHEWRIRAALWNRDWPLAQRWIAALPPALAKSDRWTYWRARALEHDPSQRENAQALYEALAQKNNVHGVYAAVRLQRPHRPTAQPLAVDGPTQKRLQQKPAVQRALAWWRLAEGDRARAEWQAALRDETPDAIRQTGLLAAQAGWHGQAILTLASQGVYDDFDVTYPIVYADEIRRAARSADLSPTILFAVMRQESLFDARAVSSAKAFGLVQLLLPTAQKVAQQSGLRVHASDALFEPQLNLQLGARYLREMQNRWDGRLIQALASYNAGPAAVERWLPPRSMDADIWLENIPYGETRNYVQRILWHITVFGWKQTGQPQDLSPLLAPIKGAT